jgi:hypothetical protein
MVLSRTAAAFTVLTSLFALIDASAAPCEQPLNCGEYNTSTVCNHTFTGCDVCDTCCHPWLKPVDICNGCVEDECTSGRHPDCCVSFECLNGQCQRAYLATGSYPTMAACEKVCKAPPLENWVVGLPYTSCTTTCNDIGKACDEKKLQVYSASTANAIFDKIAPFNCSCRVQACTSAALVPELGIYIGGSAGCPCGGPDARGCVYPSPQYHPPTCNATPTRSGVDPQGTVRRFCYCASTAQSPHQ